MTIVKIDLDTDLAADQRNSDTNEEVCPSQNSMLTFMTQFYYLYRINLRYLGVDLNDEEAWKYFEQYLVNWFPQMQLTDQSHRVVASEFLTYTLITAC